MYRGYRATSVPPALYRSTSPVSNLSRPGRLPSYCPPHGHYYGYASCSKPVITTPTAVKAATISCRPSMGLTSTRYFDSGYPTRQFGTRLSKGYGYSAISRPEIYEQAYGVSFLPGYGRDSFSAYKIADATIDDSDDLVSSSSKRDNQVLRDVERTMASISNFPPLTRPSTFVRASSVPPQLYRAPVVKSTKVIRSSAHNSPRIMPIKMHSLADDMYYKVSPPKVQYHHETVSKGSDLLSAKERMFAREFIDLTSPSATLSLKMRIQDAQNSLQKQGAMLGKYYVGPDKDDMEVDAEMRRIKTIRALRAKSVV